MMWLNKMTEIARTYPKSVISGCNHCVPDTVAREEFNKALQECESFVFNPSGKLPTDTPLEDRILAPPFKTFSIEIAGGMPITTAAHGDADVRIACILVQETGPGTFNIFCFNYFKDHECDCLHDYKYKILFTNENIKTEFSDDDEDNDPQGAYRSLVGLVNKFISRIHREQDGTEKIKKFIKIGTGTNQTKRKISRVIHISGKKQIAQVQPVQEGRSINWTHAWLVRGHWRTIKETSIGKDRDGVYQIQGKTFVNPSQRGKGDIEHKIRLVEK